MKHAPPYLFFASILLVILSACGNPLPAPTQFPPTVDEVPTPSETPAPSAVMVDDSTVFAPLPTEKVISFGPTLPNGIATDSRDGIGITFYGPDGIVLGEVRATSLASPSPATVHIAGSYTGALDFPVVFYSSENEPFSLRVSQNGQTTPLVDVQNLSGLTGVPGQPLLAYASMEPQDNGVLRTRVFLGDLTSLVNPTPVLIVDSTESRAAVPVMIRVQNGVATGLWYTLRPWGIGGEIVFDPLEGLYYLDLKDRTVYEVLPEEAVFSAISQSQIWVAYSARQDGQPILRLLNLATGQTVNMPPLAESDRGSGAAILSPGDQVVWLEARGSLIDGTFFATIRVANPEGLVLFDYPQSQFYKAAGLGEQVSIQPLGWLDEQRFLVQVSAQGQDLLPVVVQVDISTGEIASLAPGTFVGFLHHP